MSSVAITLHGLAQKLHDLHGKDKKEVNVDEVTSLLQAYSSNPSDWEKFVIFDKEHYTRTLIDKGNEKFNLIILCWAPGQVSPIHNHAGANCFVKILKGQLQETIFEWPDEQTKEHMHDTSNTIHQMNDVTYIKDSMGLHRMENPSSTQGCVTLHVYTPPFVTCKIFDEDTGTDSAAKMTFRDMTDQFGPAQCNADESCCRGFK